MLWTPDLGEMNSNPHFSLPSTSKNKRGSLALFCGFTLKKVKFSSTFSVALAVFYRESEGKGESGQDKLSHAPAVTAEGIWERIYSSPGGIFTAWASPAFSNRVKWDLLHATPSQILYDCHSENWMLLLESPNWLTWWKKKKLCYWIRHTECIIYLLSLEILHGSVVILVFEII